MASRLLSLTPEEWESLCDGCGRCCLVKLRHEDTDELFYTNVACRFLNTKTCRCSDYQNRARINPRCAVLTPDNLEALAWMPYTCAYRLLHEDRALDADPASLSVRGRVVSEEFIHDTQLPEHIISWISADEEQH